MQVGNVTGGEITQPRNWTFAEHCTTDLKLKGKSDPVREARTAPSGQANDSVLAIVSLHLWPPLDLFLAPELRPAIALLLQLPSPLPLPPRVGIVVFLVDLLDQHAVMLEYVHLAHGARALLQQPLCILAVFGYVVKSKTWLS